MFRVEEAAQRQIRLYTGLDHRSTSIWCSDDSYPGYTASWDFSSVYIESFPKEDPTPPQATGYRLSYPFLVTSRVRSMSMSSPSPRRTVTRRVFAETGDGYYSYSGGGRSRFCTSTDSAFDGLAGIQDPRHSRN